MPNRYPPTTQKEREKRALEDKLDALNPPAAPSGKPFYDDFDSYVKDYPEGERFRAWATNRGKNDQVALFLGTSVDDNALPGHYLWASLSEHRDWSDKTKTATVVQLSLHDNDDGLAVRRWPAEQRPEAEALLAQMKLLAPFDMWDAIKVFGLEGH